MISMSDKGQQLAVFFSSKFMTAINKLVLVFSMVKNGRERERERRAVVDF